MFDLQEFIKGIKYHREKLNLSCYDFAIAADINYSALANIERGNIIPTTRTIVNILNAMNKTFKECMEDSSYDVKNAYKTMIYNLISDLDKEDLNYLFNIAKTFDMSVEKIKDGI